jgi:hypothetical protein
MTAVYGPPAPNATFALAMASVAARASELAIAIAGHDHHAIQRLAIQVVDAWLVGRTAYAQIVGPIKPGCLYAESARGLLEHHYQRLLTLFKREAKVGPSTLALVAVERRRLIAAMAEPLAAWLVRAPSGDARTT